MNEISGFLEPENEYAYLRDSFFKFMKLNCQETFGKFIIDRLNPYSEFIGEILDLAEEPDFSLFEGIS